MIFNYFVRLSFLILFRRKFGKLGGRPSIVNLEKGIIDADNSVNHKQKQDSENSAGNIMFHGLID